MVMLLLSLLTALSPLPAAWRQNHLLAITDLALGLTAYVLVWWRRRWPMAIATTITLFGVLSSTAAGPGVLAAVSLATRRRWWQLVVIGLANIASSSAYAMIVPAASTPIPLGRGAG